MKAIVKASSVVKALKHIRFSITEPGVLRTILSIGNKEYFLNRTKEFVDNNCNDTYSNIHNLTQAIRLLTIVLAMEIEKVGTKTVQE